MKKTILIIAISISLLFGFSLFKGEGKIIIKKTIEGLTILIDDKNMGKTQGGDIEFTVDEGKHNIALSYHENKFGYYAIFQKEITVQPKSKITVEFNIFGSPTTLKPDKNRERELSNIFKKYNLIGLWQREKYDEELHKKILKVVKIYDDGLWTMGSNSPNVRGYSPTHINYDKRKMKISVIDTGKNIELTKSNGHIVIKYSDLNQKCLILHHNYYTNDYPIKYCLSDKITLDKKFKSLEKFNALPKSERIRLHDLEEKKAEENKLKKLKNKCIINNDSNACQKIGDIYSANKEYKKYMKLLDKSCAGGVADSCDRMGELYIKGLGTTTNYKLGLKYMKKSCKLGDDIGCANLGLMYYQGKPIKDWVQAKFYLHKGCQSKIDLACKYEMKILTKADYIPYKDIISNKYIYSKRAGYYIRSDKTKEDKIISLSKNNDGNIKLAISKSLYIFLNEYNDYKQHLKTEEALSLDTMMRQTDYYLIVPRNFITNMNINNEISVDTISPSKSATIVGLYCLANKLSDLFVSK